MNSTDVTQANSITENTRAIGNEYKNMNKTKAVSEISLSSVSGKPPSKMPKIVLKLREYNKESNGADSNTSKENIDENFTTDEESNSETPSLHEFKEISTANGDLDVVSGRRTRRKSSQNESVLQNAIALKAKSNHLSETTTRKYKSQTSNINDTKNASNFISEEQTLHKETNKTITPPSTALVDNNGPGIIIRQQNLFRYFTSVNTSNEEIQTKPQPDDSSTNDNLSSISSSVNEHVISGTTSLIKKKKRPYRGVRYHFGNNIDRKTKPKRKKAQENVDNSRCTENGDTSSPQSSHAVTKKTVEKPSNEHDSLPKKVRVLRSSFAPISTNNSSLEEVKSMDKPVTDPFPNSSIISDGTTATNNTSTVFTHNCLCVLNEKVFMRSVEEINHCQAVDSIEGKLIGCCNAVSSLDGDIALQRPSMQISFLMFCDAHKHRLSMHHCCPVCGFFCTQGKFVFCSNRHLYHRQCQLVIEGKCMCPHCGVESPSNDVSLTIEKNKEQLIFLPYQKTIRNTPSAKMSFFSSYYATDDDISESTTAIAPSRSHVMPNGKLITPDNLPDLIDKGELIKILENDILPLTNEPTTSAFINNQKVNYRNLYAAVNSGNLEKTISCLCQGLDPNYLYQKNDKNLVLHLACSKGYLNIAHVLIEAGAQIDMLDTEQNTALIIASKNGHDVVVKYLIKIGADIAFKGKDGMTALHVAARHGKLEAVHYLLSSIRAPRDYINMTDYGGYTALVWAADSNYIDVILYLLNHGADPLIRDTEHNIALHWAVHSGNVNIAEALIHFGSDVNCANIRGDTPLHVSAREDKYTCVVLLLATGARTDIRNSFKQLPIDCCQSRSSTYSALKMKVQLNAIIFKNAVDKNITKILSNDISRGNESNPIQCVNEVDDESEPTGFVYVTQNCFTSMIRVDTLITSLRYCNCGDVCTATCACAGVSLGRWYTDDARLVPNFDYNKPPMIFECNIMCSCNKNSCNNRVVQRGVTARLKIFRTNSKGWGVSTLKAIPKGSYVCEFVGEIISDAEAEGRSEDSYMFDLENREGEVYCIDAFKFGNIARFINHSCKPNIRPVKVFVGHQDTQFPHIAFFAIRDIEAHEELGFDYGDTFWMVKYKSFTCLCGAEKCKYAETTIEETVEKYSKLKLLES